MPDVRFGCTKCGKCCQNHSIPLTLDEAAVWLEDGGNVALFLEAHPWQVPPDGSDRSAHHRFLRSFEVPCGSTRVRVTTILVGIVSGSCRNLDENMRCRIYARRPLVCRIYPAEISPFIQFDVARKVCPPEAWTSGDVLLSQGRPVDAHLQWLIQKSIQTDYDDVQRKLVLCGELGIETSALAGEGYVTFETGSVSLLAAVRKAPFLQRR